MQCSDLERYLEAYLDLRLGRSRGAILRRHLSACAHCRARVEHLRAFERDLQRSFRAMERAQSVWTGLEPDLVRSGGLAEGSPALPFLGPADPPRRASTRAEIVGRRSTSTGTRPDVAADWRMTLGEELAASTSFSLEGPDGRRLDTSVPLVGWYMAANAALAIVMLVEAGYDLELIAAALERDGGIDAYIPGRAERISGEQGPLVYIDYGHSPDAFLQTLGALRRFTPGRLIMLFGVVKKNAIMMIDFAIAAQAEGKPAREAIWQGCLLRFRPIMMTTVAALFGTLPIALGYGEGADARQHG